MLKIQLTPEDLANIRFGYSPLLELVTSYRAWYFPALQGHYRRWMEEADRALYGLEFPYLHTMTSNFHDVPDFLTPTPNAPITDLESEIERLRETPNELIRKTVLKALETSESSEIHQQFLAYPRETLECLIDELRVYWAQTLAHHWPRMMAALESDMLYRARQWAVDGSETLLNDLHPRFQLRDYKIVYDVSKPAACWGDFKLNGEGLQLVPSMFSGAIMWQIAPEWRPMVIYESRGTGTWWKDSAPIPDQALEIALGEGRARVLRLLSSPSNTGEIARRLQITAGAASQHLSRLNQAGLVESRRSGRWVYYHLTGRGEKLLGLFS
jgi:hypothetical protein